MLSKDELENSTDEKRKLYQLNCDGDLNRDTSVTSPPADMARLLGASRVPERRARDENGAPQVVMRLSHGGAY